MIGQLVLSMILCLLALNTGGLVSSVPVRSVCVRCPGSGLDTVPGPVVTGPAGENNPRTIATNISQLNNRAAALSTFFQERDHDNIPESMLQKLNTDNIPTTSVSCPKVNLESEVAEMTRKMTLFTAFLRVLREDELAARSITSEHDDSPALRLLGQLIGHSEDAVCSITINLHEQLEVCVPTRLPATTEPLPEEPLRFRRDWLVVDAYRKYLQECARCLQSWPQSGGA